MRNSNWPKIIWYINKEKSMEFTALDIKDKTSKLKFRGYDEEKVNEVL